MNNYPGHTWEFNKPSHRVDFMDLTISIHNGKITTSLFEKPLNLHLYIPPHSAHPPGLLPGIVHSTLFRIFTSCSDPNDQILRKKFFLNGYKHGATKVTKLNPSSSKQSPMRKATLDLQPQKTMITPRSYSTSLSTLMTHHHIKSNRHGATPSHHRDITCPILICATQNQKKCNIQRMIIAYPSSYEYRKPPLTLQP